MEPALFAALPGARDAIPWLPLGRFPTRVHRVDGLLPPSVELWAKREDESGEAYGGNKVRKLEFLLAEARARGKTRLCTFGGIGSHHVLATAIYGRQHGFDVDAVVVPQPLSDHVREQMLADLAVGATLRPVRSVFGVPGGIWRARSLEGAYWIASGGSSVTGTLGYVSGGLELMQQIAEGQLPRPDVIYLALGSCGTAAGLVYSLWAEPAIEIAAVRVVDRVVCGARPTMQLVRGVSAALDALGPLPRQGQPPKLRVEHGYFGGAYGRATPESDAAVATAAKVGLRLEPTYTGKAMAALLADAQAGRLDGKRVLFLHTYNGVDLQPLLARSPGASALPPLLRKHFATVHSAT